jgi:hypothetical protein
MRWYCEVFALAAGDCFHTPAAPTSRRGDKPLPLFGAEQHWQITMNNQSCALRAEGAQIAASNILLITSSGTGSDLKRRIARAEHIVSKIPISLMISILMRFLSSAASFPGFRKRHRVC